MHPIQHVFFGAGTVDLGSYVDLEIRFVRPRERRDEQREVQADFDRLIRARGLNPLGTSGSIFDSAVDKGQHSTLTASFSQRQLNEVRQLAHELNAAQDSLYNQTRRATRRFEPEIAQLMRRNVTCGPSL